LRQRLALDPPIPQVPAGAVGRFHEDRAHSLSIAGEAEVPLTSGILARFVVFRDSIGELAHRAPARAAGREGLPPFKNRVSLALSVNPP
jgi:hypothetical protein